MGGRRHSGAGWYLYEEVPTPLPTTLGSTLPGWLHYHTTTPFFLPHLAHSSPTTHTSHISHYLPLVVGFYFLLPAKRAMRGSHYTARLPAAPATTCRRLRFHAHILYTSPCSCHRVFAVYAARTLRTALRTRRLYHALLLTALPYTLLNMPFTAAFLLPHTCLLHGLPFCCAFLPPLPHILLLLPHVRSLPVHRAARTRLAAACPPHTDKQGEEAGGEGRLKGGQEWLVGWAAGEGRRAGRGRGGKKRKKAVEGGRQQHGICILLWRMFYLDSWRGLLFAPVLVKSCFSPLLT